MGEISGQNSFTEPLLINTDSSSLEPPPFQKLEEGEHHITLFRAVAVLTNVITGVGMLGIPFCFCSGVGTNLIVMLSIAALSCFSFSVLIDSAVVSGVIDYPRLIRSAFTKKNLQWIPDATIFFLLFGGTILYLQFSASMMMSAFGEINNAPKFLTNPWFVGFVIQFIIDLPLVLLKTMNALSFVSLASIILIACYVVHSIYYFGKDVHDNGFDHNSQFVGFRFDLSQILPSLAIQASSFTCHPSIFPVLVKLERPTKFRLNLVMLLVTLVATLLYLISGIFPYLTLFNKILDPVVLNFYNEGQLFTTIIKACYSVILVLTAPILVFACRLSVNDLIFSTPMTPLRHILIGVSLLVLSTLVSVTVKQIKTVFGFVGGVAAPLIVYIMPSIFFLRICKDSGSKIKKLCAFASIVIGVIFIVVCLYDSIKTIVKS